MPEYASYPVKEVRKVFEANGIYALEDFSDGQTIWGTERMREGQYPTGEVTIGSEYKPGRYELDTVRKIVEHLGKGEALGEIEKYLGSHILDQNPED